MEKRDDLISVITPLYNGEKYVAGTIESVLAQTYPTWEQIIVDDGSTDSSASIVESFCVRDPRIRLIRQKNAGSSAARNTALREAKGRYIVFLDTDDLWDPNFLATQLTFIREKEAAIVFGSYRRIDGEGKSLLNDFIVPDKASYKDILLSCPLSCLTSMIDREKTGEVLFDERLGSLRDDYVLWLRLLKRVGPAIGNKAVMASYRIHTGGVTSNKWKMIRPQYRVYRHFEDFSILRSLYYTLRWGLIGIKKYS